MTADARPLAIPAYVAVAALVVAAHFGTAFNVLLVLAASFPLLFFFGARPPAPRRASRSRSAVTLLGIVWIGIPLVHAVLLRDLPDHGAALLIDVLVGTFVADTAAYATGRMFGSHKIAPTISPEQDDRGADRRLPDRHHGLLVRRPLPGLALRGRRPDHRRRRRRVAPVGDLFESMLKRDLGTKDTGTIFGPHGGILDRLDAVFFTVVVGYYLAVALVY